MPLGPNGQQFWLEYNGCIFASKLVNSIYRGTGNKLKILCKGPRNKLKILTKKKIIIIKLHKFWTRIPLGPTDQEFWPDSNVGVVALKPVDSIYRGPCNVRKILYKEKNISGKLRTWMPIGPSHPTGQEFWLECNVDILTWKPIDSIYRGPWNKRKILHNEKKSSGKLRTRMPIGPSRPTGQEFWLECNVGVFAWKPVDSIYRGPRNKRKIL